MTRENAPSSASELNAFLAHLFQAHGVTTTLEGEWILLPEHGLRIHGAIVRVRESAGGRAVQLDVRVVISPGRLLIESFVGIGATREQAVLDAQQHFARNVFHVILAAFCQRDREQVIQEEWLINGQQRLATIGNVEIRGQLPESGMAWFRQFEDKLKVRELGAGTHWVRLFYAQSRGKTQTCEVLFDNDVWEEMQAEMADVDWPCGEDFYSVRVFLVLQGGMDVSPAAAFSAGSGMTKTSESSQS